MPWRSASCAAAGDIEFRRGDRARRQRKRVPTGDQERCGTLAALSASHHQMVGNAASSVFRHVLRTAEAIPARRALLAVGPLRHDVEIPQQHAVERLGGGDQFVAVLGEDHALDQRIDRRILDADQIARAGLIGGLRTPEAALLVAGRQRLAPGRDDDVEIPLPQPVLVLRGIDHAHVHRHADAFAATACRTARNARSPDRRPEIRSRRVRRSWR